MKHPFLYALTAIALSASAAGAEPVRMSQAVPGLLPASEVAAIVRSAGFVPLSPACSAATAMCCGRARPTAGRCASSSARAAARFCPLRPVVAAGPGGERLGAYERMDGPPPPHGYVPPPPIMHDNDRPMARPQAVIPSAPPRTARGAVPETPDYMPPPSAEPSAIMREERGEHGLLPPPPDRFPSRTGAVPPAEKPAARPAPVKRAAAPPLPKPRPAG